MLLEIPAVIVILLFVCFVLVRAFTSPVARHDERPDIFMRRHTPGNNPSEASSRKRSGKQVGAG
jgi:hypothetical protein